MLALLLAWVTQTEAACPVGTCLDDDCDNYFQLDTVTCPTANDRSDCVDSDATINPNAVEVGYDQVDQDCDSKDGISRKYVDDFTDNVAGDWTATGGVTWPDGDTVSIPGNNNIQLSGDFEHLRGTPHVIVDVESLTGACSIKLTAGGPPTGATGAITTTQSITTTGTQVFNFSASLAAPLIVTEIMFKCLAGQSMALDWMSVQDGTLEWPPAADLNLSWEDTSLPAGGASNVVLVGADDGLYAGSDEGGVYWFDGTDWMTLNGVDVDLWTAYDQAAWDVLPVDNDTDGIVDTIYTLTGDPYGSAIYGGLWYTDDGGVSWTQAFDQDDGIAAYSRIHPCDDNFDDEAARAGGHLLARDATSETLYVGSHAVGDEGVYMVEETSLSSCQVSGLPAGSMPAALVLTEVAGDTLLLVGLKGEDGTTDESLYTCEIPTNADCTTNTVTCTAVTGSAEIDARDIEVDVLDPEMAYVADGGRFDSSGSCSFSDGAVWDWDIAGDALTDVSDNLEPPIDGTGNVVDVAGEVVGVSMDPNGDYLFAYFPGSQDLPYDRGAYSTTVTNAKVWRADVTGLGAGSGSDWDGLQGIDNGGYADRRDVVGGIDFLAGGATTPDIWIDDQLGRETWAPAYAVDGIFWDDDANAGTRT